MPLSRNREPAEPAQPNAGMLPTNTPNFQKNWIDTGTGVTDNLPFVLDEIHINESRKIF